MVSSFQKVIDAKCEQRQNALATAGVGGTYQVSPCDRIVFADIIIPRFVIERTHAQIVSHIQNGEWTASEVLEAYISRAALAHETTNCLTEGTLTG